MAPAPKPHLVLIPGAWHIPAHYSLLISKLEARGYTVHTRQMPAVGNPDPDSLIDASQDIAAVNELVTDAIADGNDVLVIPHSWGGYVVGSALQGLSKAERAQEGKRGGVVRCAYMAAYMLDEGFTWDMKTLPEFIRVEPPRVHATTPTTFYNDLPPTDQAYWFSLLLPHALVTFTATTGPASWKKIPVSYLLCEDDLALPAAVQEGMVHGARDKGAEVEVTRVKSGHSPFLKCVDEVVEWIEGAVRLGGGI